MFDIGTIGALSDGMHMGWTSPMIPILQSPDTPMAITEDDILWLEILITIGAFCGLPITIYLANKAGRKLSIILSAIVSIISWVLIAVANRVEYIYVSRYIAGIAGNVAFVSAPMYIAEIAEEKVRGFLSGMIYIMMLAGNLLIYVIGPFMEIYLSASVPIVLLLILLCTFTFMPESPYYLVILNKREQAAKSLQYFRDSPDVEDELREISIAVERQQAENNGTLLDLIRIPSNRKATLIMVMLNFGQNFSCIYVIFMNLHSILEAANSTFLQPEYAAIIFASLLILGALALISVVDKFGRKILLCTSSILTGIALAVLAGYFAAKNAGVDVSSVRWLPVATVMAYAIFYKLGLGMVPIILTAELFPTSVKALGMTMADGVLVIAGIFVINVYTFLAKLYGIEVPFFLFAILCIVLGVLCAIVVPETKGKTLEEIQYILKGIPLQQREVVLDKCTEATN